FYRITEKRIFAVLDFHEYQKILFAADDIDLQITDPPVPLQDIISFGQEIFAGNSLTFVTRRFCGSHTFIKLQNIRLADSISKAHHRIWQIWHKRVLSGMSALHRGFRSPAVSRMQN